MAQSQHASAGGSKADKEPFIRWQGYLRESLNSHVTLVVGWAAAGLAFCGSLLNSDNAHFTCAGTVLFILTSLAFLVCLCLALFISRNRLDDTRATLRIVDEKLKQQQTGNAAEATDEIQQLRQQAESLGKRTWDAIDIQLWIFIGATLLLVATAAVLFSDRLAGRTNHGSPEFRSPHRVRPWSHAQENPGII